MVRRSKFLRAWSLPRMAWCHWLAISLIVAGRVMRSVLPGLLAWAADEQARLWAAYCDAQDRYDAQLRS